jgi:uracil phosphoribosyltransferase
VRQGLGQAVYPLISRAIAVPKSAFALPGERPTPQRHLESFTFHPQLINPDQITVVDDFITKGATTIAAASLLKHHFPEAKISVFGMIRTRGLQPDVERIVEPCIGLVTLNVWGGSDREP